MLSTVKSVVRRLVRPPLHRPEIRLRFDVLGTEYGGWPLLRQETPKEPLILSFGIGDDISFDLAAIERRAATIHAFDPTPRCLDWIQSRDLPKQFHFHPIGLASSDGFAEFFPPEQDAHVSFSAKPAPNSDQSAMVRAPVKRLSTIMAELAVKSIDVLKMDIEGFEYGVLKDIMSSDIRPSQLLIEFHHRMYGIDDEKTLTAVRALQQKGYALFYVSSGGHEYGFVDRHRLPPR